ncbi:MAG: YfhO family protein [Armatimonadetes bacterium]|nr:YfhO family protein [Armatimonadota bacterium]
MNLVRLTAALWFAIIACAVFWRVVLRGEVLYYGDIMLYFHPLLAFQHEWLSRGVLPLWNPHTLFGQPLAGNPQEALLYPSTLLVAWLGAERAISWGAVAHLWLAALGVYAFARRRGYSPQASLAAGTLWCLCGAVTLRSQHVTILQTLAWYGWSLWAVEGLMQRPDVRRAAALSLVLALASLAGSPQMFHTLALLLLGWTLFRWREVQERRSVLCWGGVAMLVALLLGGAHWLPLAELLRHTERDALPLKESTGYTLRPDHLLLFLVPNLFGFPWRGEYMLNLFYWEMAFFVGTVPLLVVLVRWRRAEGEERFWKRAALLSLWMAVGPYGGLYLLAYYLIPGMQSFRTPLRWTAVTDFALCMWAAWALEQVVAGRRWWRLPLGLLVLATVWALIDQSLAHALAPSVVKDRTLSPEQAVVKASAMAGVLGGALWRATGMSALAVGLLSLQGKWRWWIAMGVTVAELLWIAIPANPTCSPDVLRREPEVASRLRESGQRLFVPDTSPIWLRYVNAHDFGRNDTETLRRWRESLASNIGMAHGLSEASGYEPGALTRSQKHFLQMQKRWREDPLLLRQAGVGAVAFGDSAEGWRVTFVAAPGARAWMAEDAEAVRWQMPTPQQVTLSPDGAGTLVLADSAYPGWQVWIDGAPARWRPFGGCFRAVEVPQGARHVEWRYQPDTFRVGLFLTSVGCSIWAGMAAFAFSRFGATARR